MGEHRDGATGRFSATDLNIRCVLRSISPTRCNGVNQVASGVMTPVFLMVRFSWCFKPRWDGFLFSVHFVGGSMPNVAAKCFAASYKVRLWMAAHKSKTFPCA